MESLGRLYCEDNSERLECESEKSFHDVLFGFRKVSEDAGIERLREVWTGRWLFDRF
jgi:hypothetical protein